jgi:hypothetical protein
MCSGGLGEAEAADRRCSPQGSRLFYLAQRPCYRGCCPRRIRCNMLIANAIWSRLDDPPHCDGRRPNGATGTGLTLAGGYGGETANGQCPLATEPHGMSLRYCHCSQHYYYCCCWVPVQQLHLVTATRRRQGREACRRRANKNRRQGEPARARYHVARLIGPFQIACVTSAPGFRGTPCPTSIIRCTTSGHT